MRDNKRRRLTRIYDDVEQQVLEFVRMHMLKFVAFAQSRQALTVQMQRGRRAKYI